ncbi:MAG: hypothetical protein O3B24_11400 [Verrucomicrobia bacterium]|nr:hypothetical protein [Verrucomicrobiota bacterium]
MNVKQEHEINEVCLFVRALCIRDFIDLDLPRECENVAKLTLDKGEKLLWRGVRSSAVACRSPGKPGHLL